MKILLINPPWTIFPGSGDTSISIPLGIMYIGSVLDQNGYEVEIMDTLISDSPLQKPRNKGDVEQYSMPWKNIKEEVRKRSPDIVGITNPFSSQIDNAIKVSEIVKNIDNEILTIVGGPHVSVMPVQFLKNAKCVDIAVIGEGEYTMRDIIKYYEGDKNINEIEGIAHRVEGDVKSNKKRAFIKNLDELPFPAYHLVDMEKYFDAAKKSEYRGSKNLRKIPMITSRGCPFNCVFCSIHLHMGKVWRGHSKEYVIDHVDHVVNKYGVEHIYFEDDNITLNIKRFEGIIDSLIERNIKVSWNTPNGIRIDKLNKNILKKMKKGGCADLRIGVESGDQYILDNIIDKNLCLDDVVKVAKMCKELNIKLQAFYVIGFPGEKRENMIRTAKFALTLKKKYGTDMVLLIATPMYGTRLYNICKEKGYLTQELTPRLLSEGTQIYGRGLINTEDFTAEDVKKIALDTIRIYNRYLLLDYLKNPSTAIKKILNHPEIAAQFIKELLRKSSN